MIKGTKSVVKDDGQVRGKRSRVASGAFKEKAPRGETGLSLRREQLGEARRTNLDHEETFQAGEGGKADEIEALAGAPSSPGYASSQIKPPPATEVTDGARELILPVDFSLVVTARKGNAFKPALFQKSTLRNPRPAPATNVSSRHRFAAGAFLPRENHRGDER